MSAVEDPLDRQLVALLQEDGRASFAHLSRALGLSESAVRQRVSRLIEGNALRVIGVANPTAFGHSEYAMVGVRVAPGVLPARACAALIEREEVTYVSRCGGRYDLLIELICVGRARLTELLDELFYSNPHFALVEAMPGLSILKYDFKWSARGLLPPDAA